MIVQRAHVKHMIIIIIVSSVGGGAVESAEDKTNSTQSTRVTIRWGSRKQRLTKKSIPASDGNVQQKKNLYKDLGTYWSTDRSPLCCRCTTK